MSTYWRRESALLVSVALITGGVDSLVERIEARVLSQVLFTAAPHKGSGLNEYHTERHC